MTKFLRMLAATLAFAPAASFAATVVDPTRIPVSEGWRFHLDPKDTGLAAGWEKAMAPDADWPTTSVPHALPADYDGVAWYRNKLSLTPAQTELARNGHLFLTFGQVDDEARVYLDGRPAAISTSYNTPFFVKIAPPAAAAASTPLQIQVAVRCLDRGLGGGILGPVALQKADSVRDLYAAPWLDKAPNNTLATLGDTVMYSMYVRNFTPEGTFQAARKRLPELKAMGVNALWLLPIHPIGATARKGPDGSPYAIRDYTETDPALGTKADLKAFTADAHAAGMKVIIDCVMNHTSPDSVLAAAHPDWFRLNAQGKPTASNPEWYDIIDLDWTKREVWEYSFGFLENWVTECGIDGYRCDVADLMPGPFWKELRGRLDKVKPGKILMLAESEAPEKLTQGFDIIYNQAVRDHAIACATGKDTAANLRSAIDAMIYGVPAGGVALLFTENHDKERAVNEFGGPEPAKMGAALMCTLPGVPLIYTGTEVGAAGRRDDEFFTRKPVDFSKDPGGLKPVWTSLLATRAKHKALRTGDFRWLDITPAETELLAYERTAGSEKVRVYINPTARPLKAEKTPDGPVELPAFAWKIVP